MKVYRITISSWTSSFRYPNIISGYQPTLLVPPISTVLGFLNACSGQYLKHEQLFLGYYFKYGSKTVDLETIYQIEINEKGIPKNQVKSNVIKREFLFDCQLILYVVDKQYIKFLKSPIYQILLGRSSDLATIEKIEEVELEKIENADKIKGQVIPFVGNYLPGLLQALPKYFTDTIPRSNIGTEPFSVIPYDVNDFQTNIIAYRDTIEGEEIDIYFHNLKFEYNYYK